MVTPNDLLNAISPFVQEIVLKEGWTKTYLTLVVRGQEWHIYMTGNLLTLENVQTGMTWEICSKHHDLTFIAVSLMQEILLQEIYDLEEEKNQHGFY